MVSRLDRLFILLDTGSDESVRHAAAKQLGEVQRIQPNELQHLLQKIKEYSTKAVWGTRVAAGQATRYVLEQVEVPPDFKWITNREEDSKDKCRSEIVLSTLKDKINFAQIIQQFDLNKITTLCPSLVSVDTSSTGNSDDAPQANPSSSKSSSAKGSRASAKRPSIASKGTAANKKEIERLQRQRQLINKELGISMDVSLNLGVKSTDIVTNDDLQVESTDNPDESNCSRHQDILEVLKTSINNYNSVIEELQKLNCIEQEPKIRKSSETSEECSSPSSSNSYWQLGDISMQYLDNLFHPSWEVRHGAAIALREIVKLQGKQAGRISSLSKEANDILNELWLLDMSLFSLSVLALDKFGDFLFDQVVAPVRENSAQLFSCCLANISEDNACLMVSLLLKMLEGENWEARHGGILGLKYSLNVVGQEATKKMLIASFDQIVNCLADPVDDVSAEAAAALVPVKDLVISIVPEKAPKLVKFLWTQLESLDELTASTGNLVQLLASLITSSSSELRADELNRSIPRLWPLLSHSSSSVRISVSKALIALIKSPKGTCLSWMSEELLSTAIKLVFQRVILENVPDCRIHLEEIWANLIQIDPIEGRVQRVQLLKITSQCLNYWLCLVLQPSNVPIDRGSPMWLNLDSNGSISSSKPDADVYIGSYSFNSDNEAQQKIQIANCRMLGAKMLGMLYARVVCDFDESLESQYAKDAMKYLADMFNYYLSTKSANQRIVSGWTVESWASQLSEQPDLQSKMLEDIAPKNLVDQLYITLQETSVCYDELAANFTRLQQEARDFVAAAAPLKIEIALDLPTSTDRRALYNLSQINSLSRYDLNEELSRLESKRVCNGESIKAKGSHTVAKNVMDLMRERQASLRNCLKTTNQAQKSLSISVLGSISCAMIAWRIIPEKQQLLVSHILDSIECEEDVSLQEKSVNYLIALFDLFQANIGQYADSVEMIIERLVTSLSCEVTSRIKSECTIAADNEQKLISKAQAGKIIQLDTLQRRAELARSLRRQSSQLNASQVKRSLSTASSIDLSEDSTSVQDNSKTQAAKNDDQSIEKKLRGSKLALKRLAEHLGPQLPVRLPKFWKSITSDIHEQILTLDNSKLACKGIDTQVTSLIEHLHLLTFVGDSLDTSLQGELKKLLEHLASILKSENSLIRHYSSQCIGMISNLLLDDTIEVVKEKILPMLESGDLYWRCGSIEAVALVIENLQLKLVGLTNLFILDILRRMSDQNDQVRLMATHCFGKLLSLMPLNIGTNGHSQNIETNIEHSDKKASENQFIEQLLDPKKLTRFELPFEIEAKLRSYQQEGLNWLAFLNRYNLHGILCDEMGLGKTLMTICMVAADHYNEGRLTGVATDSKASNPSLIVCPSTLTEHWLYEIDKFLPKENKAALKTLSYSGNLNDRLNLRNHILSRSSETHPEIDLVVASYDIVRNDIEFFKEVQWNYCVLDEGHIIKNGKTKLSQAIRLIIAKHRLILSGTPIQNNVTELWSLFDFLMPGLLGSERQFNARYARPILQSRDVKCSSRELEAGALAMESLHRQVLPFVLRRLKDDVLDDLPPKIIQDYYCELSPLQARLYEDFTRSQLCKEVTRRKIENLNSSKNEPTGGAEELGTQDEEQDEDQDEKDPASDGKNHIFKALQYLKSVCNHPKLVLNEKHPQYIEIKRSLEREKSSLDEISHSSKLIALKQLLIDCDIGQLQPDERNEVQDLTLGQSVVNQHRALIFCQSRSMVSIVEEDLLKRHLPGITHLRLDGSIPANKRHSIVQRFNSDPSIDVLLLTTQIGGLGLNLSCADTVIFVEHDWNPTRDLQAMDRAHRLGQKKVVNVYRLITKATLEEKIMGLQKFKTMVSNTVINQDNTGLASMNLDQLLDIFEGSSNALNQADVARAGRSSAGSAALELLPELWDQEQYENEYDLENFISSLKGDH